MMIKINSSRNSTRLLLASGNQHKLREMRELLTDTGIELLGAADAGGLPEVIEDGSTFTENAVKKAVEVSKTVDLPVLADDSGFVVAALNGAPGVCSARYAGENASDRDNVEKLLRQMKNVEERQAAFVCILAVAVSGRLLTTVEGRVGGWVTTAPRGGHGFGYDPVFIPYGFERTFGEMSAATKNQISHRARAVQNLVTRLDLYSK